MKVGLWNFKITSNGNSKLRRFRADSKNRPLVNFHSRKVALHLKPTAGPLGLDYNISIIADTW